MKNLENFLGSLKQELDKNKDKKQLKTLINNSIHQVEMQIDIYKKVLTVLIDNEQNKKYTEYVFNDLYFAKISQMEDVDSYIKVDYYDDNVKPIYAPNLYKDTHEMLKHYEKLSRITLFI